MRTIRDNWVFIGHISGATANIHWYSLLCNGYLEGEVVIMQTVTKDDEVIARGVNGSARAANCCDKNIRNAVKAGELRHARIGNKIIILDSDLRAWIESRMQAEYQPMRKYSPPKSNGTDQQMGSTTTNAQS